ncbi:BnaC01g34680D [Brassica napus]|uniref:BnaC01g34680D protein n=1 Tax=Brassica napus TaxID=3708 RepID=A0A078IIP2_BRANA|nr:BnaC01g34680D [Brassica napus]
MFNQETRIHASVGDNSSENLKTI